MVIGVILTYRTWGPHIVFVFHILHVPNLMCYFFRVLYLYIYISPILVGPSTWPLGRDMSPIFHTKLTNKWGKPNKRPTIGA